MTNLPNIVRLSISPTNVSEVQSLFSHCKSYFLLVGGEPPRSDEAQRFFEELPLGKTLTDKYAFGIYASDILVGCADIVRSFPNEATAYPAYGYRSFKNYRLKLLNLCR